MEIRHNCVEHPTIASRNANDALDKDSQILADQLGIIPINIDPSLTLPISDKIKNCLVDYCTSTSQTETFQRAISQ